MTSKGRFKMISNLRFRLKQILIAFDQLCNTLLGGWADETFSARCWRLNHRRGWGLVRRVVDAIFFWDREHCFTSYVVECNGGHLPPAMRQNG